MYLQDNVSHLETEMVYINYSILIIVDLEQFSLRRDHDLQQS